MDDRQRVLALRELLKDPTSHRVMTTEDWNQRGRDIQALIPNEALSHPEYKDGCWWDEALVSRILDDLEKKRGDTHERSRPDGTDAVTTLSQVDSRIESELGRGRLDMAPTSDSNSSTPDAVALLPDVADGHAEEAGDEIKAFTGHAMTKADAIAHATTVVNTMSKPYKCPLRGCSISCTTRDTLIRHLVNGRERFGCPVDECDLDFSRIDRVRAHVRDKHPKAALDPGWTPKVVDVFRPPPKRVRAGLDVDASRVSPPKR